MGTTPNVLDQAIDKALNAPAPAAQTTAARPRGNVIDFAVSKALGQAPALPAGSYQTRKGGPVIQSGQGEQTNELGNKVIVPMPGEDFSGTMERAAAYGRTVTPGQIQQETQSAAYKAPMALAAGPVMAASQLAIPTAAGEIFGPSTVSVPARDAVGRFIGGKVAAEGPSVAQAGANIIINAVKSHPIISAYIGTHLANALGIPLPKVLKAMAGIREVAE
jgi:hypothetical protein